MSDNRLGPGAGRDLFPQRLEGASSLQRKLAGQVCEEPLSAEPRWVGGADMAYDSRRGLGYAAIVVLEAGSGRLVDLAHFLGPVSVPYVPGFLSFREGPTLLAAWERLEHRPDLLICDGHGRAHPRRFGVACHLGLALDVPTIGVAKSRLIGEHRDLGRRRGCSVRLRHQGETIGLVVRTRDGVKPVFVSVGHRIALPDAKRLVLQLTPRYKLPEPQRLADREVGRMRREDRAQSDGNDDGGGS
jgi:deoxyribonuclease V